MVDLNSTTTKCVAAVAVASFILIGGYMLFGGSSHGSKPENLGLVASMNKISGTESASAMPSTPAFNGDNTIDLQPIPQKPEHVDSAPQAPQSPEPSAKDQPAESTTTTTTTTSTTTTTPPPPPPPAATSTPEIPPQAANNPAPVAGNGIESNLQQNSPPPPPSVVSEQPPNQDNLPMQPQPGPIEAIEPSNPITYLPEELSEWDQFKLRYNRQYAAAEEPKRQAIFIDNLRFIQSFNGRNDVSFKLGVNHFADQTQDETNRMFIGPLIDWQRILNLQLAPVPPAYKILSMENEKMIVDWRNTTTAVVDQNICRDSAIFSAIANIESAVSISSGMAPPIKFSEQQLINCLSVMQPARVCEGNNISIGQVFEFLRQNEIDLLPQAEYERLVKAAPPPGVAPPPMLCRDLQAIRFPGAPAVRVSKSVQLPPANIQEALNNNPVVVALDASQRTFHFYRSGLYHDLNCSDAVYNMHVLLVGYLGVDETGNSQQASYLARASLGLDWGEGGHMRLLKDPTRNKCLPQHFAIYPEVVIVS